MKIIFDGKDYDVILDNNPTVEDIMEKVPIRLSLVRYAGHEYYDELHFRPIQGEEKTSTVLAGHIYYWDGWNAFVINFEDTDISPYKVVHIGEITDKSIIGLLEKSGRNIDIVVKE